MYSVKLACKEKRLTAENYRIALQKGIQVHNQNNREKVKLVDKLKLYDKELARAEFAAEKFKRRTLLELASIRFSSGYLISETLQLLSPPPTRVKNRNKEYKFQKRLASIKEEFEQESAYSNQYCKSLISMTSRCSSWTVDSDEVKDTTRDFYRYQISPFYLRSPSSRNSEHKKLDKTWFQKTRKPFIFQQYIFKQETIKKI